MLTGSDAINELTGSIIGAAMKVHSRLGPGLLEHTYAICLRHELEQVGLQVMAEVFVDLEYDGLLIQNAYRIDLVIEDKVIVELKAVEKVLPVHHSQVLTYLKLSKKEIGLLLNFNVSHLADGIKRMTRTPLSASSVEPL